VLGKWHFIEGLEDALNFMCQKSWLLTLLALLVSISVNVKSVVIQVISLLLDVDLWVK